MPRASRAHARAHPAGGGCRAGAAARRHALCRARRRQAHPAPARLCDRRAPSASHRRRLDAPAAAVELIHAYSLVHDDLPAMDDDDLRRGRPTTHRAFDEATAILAGDALQVLAFDLLANDPMPGIGDGARIEMIQLLARASGTLGMAGGQALDLAATGRRLEPRQIEDMHALKTGALIRAAVLMACAADSGLPAREARRARPLRPRDRPLLPDRRRPARRPRRSRGDRQGCGFRRAARQADLPGHRGRHGGPRPGRGTRRRRYRGARGLRAGGVAPAGLCQRSRPARPLRHACVCPLPALQ